MKQRDMPTRPDWLELASLAVLSNYFYFFMEWLFYVTKPSFMSFLPFGSKLGTLLLPALIFAMGSLALLLVLFGISRLPRLSHYPRGFLAAGALLPAVFLSATALMMVITSPIPYSSLAW